MNRERIRDHVIGALFTIAAAVVVYFLTVSPPNAPKLIAKITTTPVFLPAGILSLPRGWEFRRAQIDLIEIRERERLYDMLTKLLQEFENAFDNLKLLSDANCIFHLDIRNSSKSKATNVNVFPSDTVAYIDDKSSKLQFLVGNRVAVGDILPNETKLLTVLTRYSCPSNFSKLNNDRISVSFDGGLATLDFFHEFSPLIKFVIEHETWVGLLVFLAFVLLCVTVALFVVNALIYLFSPTPKSKSKPK